MKTSGIKKNGGGFEMKKHCGGTLISQIKQLQDRTFNKILKEEGIYELNGQQGRILFSL